MQWTNWEWELWGFVNSRRIQTLWTKIQALFYQNLFCSDISYGDFFFFFFFRVDHPTDFGNINYLSVYLSLLFSLSLLYKWKRTLIWSLRFCFLSVHLSQSWRERGDNCWINSASWGKYVHGNMYNMVLAFSCIGIYFLHSVLEKIGIFHVLQSVQKIMLSRTLSNEYDLCIHRKYVLGKITQEYLCFK